MQNIKVIGAQEHNLKNVEAEIQPGLTAVTGISGSGKSSLVFDTLYHEARRKILDILSLGLRERLSPAAVESIVGLGPTIAIGQDLLNRNPNSTLASASGLHPFFRLLYAKFARRHCPQCSYPASILTDDEILHQLLNLTRNGSLEIFAPLIQGGRGSHRTLLRFLRNAFGIDALHVDDKSWQGRKRMTSLKSDEQHDILLRITRWKPGISPRVARNDLQHTREIGATSILALQADTRHQFSFSDVCVKCGYWLEKLEPKWFNQDCPTCKGEGCSNCGSTGLHPQAAATYWRDLRLPDLLQLSVSEVHQIVKNHSFPPTADRLILEIMKRLTALEEVGLSYLTLDRPSPTLSRGEAQRVRLALTLISSLDDMLHILDEPTIGQHPQDFKQLLKRFRDIPGPVVFVEHDRVATAAADQVLDLGPDAGHLGGEVVFQGTPKELWNSDTHTGRHFSFRERVLMQSNRPPPDRFITIRQANLRNLQEIDVPIPIGRMSVIVGVSGSGKSTLVEDVLVATLSSKKPVGCEVIEGEQLQAILVDQSPIGRNPRSNPATYTKLSDSIRELFATLSEFSASHFSFNRPEGACPVCKGMGATEVKLRYLPSTWIRCETCAGKRFKDEILDTQISLDGRSISITEFYELTVSDCLNLIESTPSLPVKSRTASIRLLGALQDVGLGYMQLGQPSTTLSGGEAQRVKLAKYLGGRKLSSKIIILDEPSTGLHPHDISALLFTLNRLVEEGATLVIVEHNLDVIRAGDWIIELGPGAGDNGGQLIFSGSVEDLLHSQQSPTGMAIREESTLQPVSSRDQAGLSSEQVIHIQGAKANNLKDVELQIPKGSLTVVTGVSGSGKSSLLQDVLSAEAHRRFVETLTLYERQTISEGPEADVEKISGMGVTLTLAPERRRYEFRATVGVATEISHNLAAIMAFMGERLCTDCGANMHRLTETAGRRSWECSECHARATLAEPRHFSPSTYSAVCTQCQGIGSLQIPNPDKLITHTDKPLCNGAMHSPGFFPKGYLCKPGNHGYDMVQAISRRYDFDPATTPWEKMSDEAQRAFLFGDPEPIEVEFHSRTRSSVKTITFPGFYGFIRDWDVGGTYTDTQVCPACQGARFRPEILAVKLAGKDIHELSEMSLTQLNKVLGDFQSQHSSDRDDNHYKIIEANLRAILYRLNFLIGVGLGYLHLNRLVYTLSAGEAQRIKLAALLGSDLSSLTLLIDEPSRGMHPSELEALIRAVTELRDAGNTIVIVEHDPLIIQAADHIVDMGPDAGDDGGEIVDQGSVDQVSSGKGMTAQWLRGEREFQIPSRRREPTDWIQIYGARAHNLKIESAQIPLGTLTGVCGVSGSGKSSLIIDTLGRVLAPIKHTTSVAYEPLHPGEHDRISGAPSRTLVVDQARTGITSPSAFLRLDRPLRKIYLSSPIAQSMDLSESSFSRNCSVCRGTGQRRTDMGFLPSVYSPCETCQGTGYPAEVWDIQLNGLSLPVTETLTLDQVYARFGEYTPIAHPIDAARKVGLGYLVLRQPGRTLSGGEAQRLKLARELGKRTRPKTFYLFDEPTIGQHLEDIERLAGVLQDLVDGGHSVLIVEHHPHLLAMCDWLIEMGPGGGPEGGEIIASGTPEQLAQLNTPTAGFLREILGVSP